MTAGTKLPSWLGAGFSFDGVKDETSSSGDGLGLLQAGLYKAKIENAIVGVIGEKDTPALIVVFELENGKKITNNFWLTKLDDAESANVKNLRNLLTRSLYSELTEKEFKALDAKEVNERCEKVLTAIAKNGNNASKLNDKNVLVDITQKPFISVDKNTKAMKFTSVNKNSVIGEIPQALLKIIEEKETNAGVTYDKVPEFAFTNALKMYGIGFYNDFDENKKLYDTKAYQYVQSLKTPAKAEEAEFSDDLIGEEEIPF